MFSRLPLALNFLILLLTIQPETFTVICAPGPGSKTWIDGKKYFGLPLSNFDKKMLPFKLKAFVSSKIPEAPPGEPVVGSDLGVDGDYFSKYES